MGWRILDMIFQEGTAPGASLFWLKLLPVNNLSDSVNMPDQIRTADGFVMHDVEEIE